MNVKSMTMMRRTTTTTRRRTKRRRIIGEKGDYCNHNSDNEFKDDHDMMIEMIILMKGLMR